MLRLAIIGVVCSLLTGTTSLFAGEDDDAHTKPGEPSAKLSEEVRAQAERYFRAGLSLHKLDDFDDAAVAYEASLRLMPTKSALFNLANCHRAMHQYVEALRYLERLHAEFGDQLAEPMLSKSRAQIQELRNLTGTLSVETEPPGASIYVDGMLIGETPLAEPVRLKLGEHIIEARLQGYETQRTTVDLLPRAELLSRIEFVGERETSISTATNTEAARERVQVAKEAPPTDPDGATISGSRAHGESELYTPNSSMYRPWGWAGIAAGLASVAVGGLIGVQALNLDAELHEACPLDSCPQNRRSDLDRLDRLTSTADVLVGVGAIVAAAGAVLVLWPNQADEETQPTVALGATPSFIGVVTGSVW